MEKKDFQFRTATLGGFVKQDVLDYLEQSSKVHADRMEQVQRMLERCSEEQTSLRERAGKAEADAEELSAHIEELKAENAGMKERLSACEEKNAQLQAELDGLKEEAARLRSRLEVAEPSAHAYELVKDRTAGIELEAHCRARNIETEAAAKAEKARQEMLQWISRVQTSYEAMCRSIGGTAQRVTEELEKMRSTVETSEADFVSYGPGLEVITKICEGPVEGIKMPEPLPLDEEG